MKSPPPSAIDQVATPRYEARCPEAANPVVAGDTTAETIDAKDVWWPRAAEGLP
jgi:hypothetical protein